MIREDLIAERVVIDVYTEMIRYFADNDPTTRVLMEKILKDEEEHASDLADLLYIVDPASGRTEGQDPGTRPLSLQPEGQEQSEASQGRVAQQRGIGRNAARAARTEQFANRRSAVPPAHAPGTTGRPTRSRPQQTNEAEARDVEADAQMGATRSVHVTKPNRKKRVA